MLKDYKYYELHEHLFDGKDDIWLSHLDQVFDAPVLDHELLAKEVPEHIKLMAIVGGLLALPTFAIVNMVVSGDATVAGVLTGYTDRDTFYYNVFGGAW